MQRIINSNAVVSTSIGFFILASANFALAQSTEPASQLAARQPNSTQPAAVAKSAAAKLVEEKVPGVTASMTIDELLDQGKQALKDHSYEAAVKIFQAILGQDQRNVGAMSGLANAYEAQSQQFADSADPTLRPRAKELKSAAASWFKAVAQLLYSARDYASAERIFLHTLSLTPSDYLSQLGLARVYMALNRDANAIEQFNECLRNPSTPEGTKAAAYLELGQTCRRGSLNAQALDALDKAAKLDPNNADIYHEMARAYFERSSPEMAKATTAINLAISKDRNRPEFRQTHARILLERKDYANARDEANNSIKLGIFALQAQRDDLRLLKGLNDCYEVFLQVMQRAIAEDPASTVEDRLGFVQALEEQGKIAQMFSLFKCLDVLLKIPKAEQQNPRLLLQLIEIYRSLFQIKLFQVGPVEGYVFKAESAARSLVLIEPKNSVALEALQFAQMLRAQTQPAQTQPAQTQPASAPTGR